MSMQNQDRKIDIVVFGATGFTGKLVSKYLQKNSGGAKWAVAGRSESKLKETLKEIGIEGVEVIVADADDEVALKEMCLKTKAVITLAGPYYKYGNKLVKTCAETGTHYFDLSGETPWVADQIQLLHRAALSTHAILVFSCGYDSVPSDLGALLAIQRLKRVGGPAVRPGKTMAGFKMRGGISGGTATSALGLRDEPLKRLIELGRNGYILSPMQGPQKLRNIWVVREEGSWGGFWAMAMHNTAIVRRSWGIFETTNTANAEAFSYGPEFTYEEFLTLPDPVSSFFISLGLYIFFGFLLFMPGFGWFLQKIGPKAGEGPSQKTQDEGWFETTTTAHSNDDEIVTRAVVKGNKDPGYASTAIMIAECALSVIHDYDRLPLLAKEGGPLTPATALGNVLVERLEKTGVFTFTTDEIRHAKKLSKASKKAKKDN